MSEPKVLNGEDRRTRVRLQPKPSSVLTATSAASRPGTNGTLSGRNQEEGGLLQRQCARGIHTRSWQHTSSNVLPDKGEALGSSVARDFSRVPAHTIAPSPVIQPKLTRGPVGSTAIN